MYPPFADPMTVLLLAHRNEMRQAAQSRRDAREARRNRPQVRRSPHRTTVAVGHRLGTGRGVTRPPAHETLR
jgi:hypothetical protein